MSSSSELQFIVERLASPPFNERLSLVTLDEKSPFELVELLNKVVAELNGREHTPNVRNEAPEVTGSRMASFLAMLNYNAPCGPEELARGIGDGAREVVYPALAWLLVHFGELQKRAYLARYLAPLDIPAEILQDRSVAESYSAYQELQERFKEVHKQVDVSRSSGFSPANIKADIAEMQRDKEQLLSKISRVKRKVQGLPNLAYQLEVVSSLRKEQEEELALAERGREQQHLLHRTEMEMARRVDKLQALQSSYTQGNPEALVRKLLDDTQVNRYLVEEKLPYDLHLQEVKINELSRVLSANMSSEADLDGIKAEIAGINDDIRRLMEARMANANPLADALAMYRQNAKVAAHKKESVADKLNKLMDEKAKLDKAIEARVAELESTGKRMMQGDEWNAFKAQVKTQTAKYKELKATKDSMEIEQGILARTQMLLEEEAEEMSEYLHELEVNAGIEGYTETESQLQNIVTDRAELNTLKAATLDEISALVEKITRKIEARSKELEPAVRKLQALKQEKLAIEGDWSKAKAQYEAVEADISTGQLELATTVRALRAEVADLEAKYHLANANIANAQRELAKADAERAAATGGARVAARFATYHELYSKQLSEQMSLSKSLQKKKRKIKEAHEPNMAQIAMIGSLHSLLLAKKDSAAAALQRNKATDAGAQLPTAGGAGPLGDGGANRLVID
ncbi:intraflagellar transport 81 [Thecamonas trahens ATCC 50062]|uniref:Intraflagellar transport 81 n=1 Tax=Thecamonas trahens ATCC 50062 TaxID=461836 RepID=A0A0L0DE32_THETB|nr:intraflagellar transport 81 [Thecamonas trahens ATCC 50062]KNC50567.1 intraflagellar transport 81 [Thecamonas trahens ATCC 50062]|eukprot:XP_013762457.1 intraflagellar transport 81 [Thecamonas trahens ATCC 50062]